MFQHLLFGAISDSILRDGVLGCFSIVCRTRSLSTLLAQTLDILMRLAGFMAGKILLPYKENHRIQHMVVWIEPDVF